MKKAFKIIWISLLVILAVSAFAACGSVESISVSEGARPQTTYVVGQDINLAGGMLTVNNGKGSEQIPLDSKDVSVSGYDKDKLGTQTVTIEYGGKTTTLTVNVVQRLTVSGAVTEYLVGSEPDASRGSVTFTANDGNTRVFRLASDDVKIEKYDFSSAASNKEVEISLIVGGESYRGSYKVNVYEIEEVSFKRPNKITYGSHYEGEIETSGGYFTLTGNGGKVTSTVNITPDMVSGLDLSAVNAENREQTQQLTVTFGGKTYNYSVKVSYTDISLLRDNIAAFDAINWEGESEPAVNFELGELAMTLMQTYFEMSEADRALIGNDAVLKVAKAAMVYGFDIWAENIMLFNGTFAIEYGEIVLYCESYETVKDSLALFEDKDSAIYTVSPLLLKLIETYGDTVIYENETTYITFTTYPVLTEYVLSVLQTMLTNTVTVYEHMAKVPYGYTAGALADYKADIEAAYVTMATDNAISYFPTLYHFVNDWREDGALFDIFYTYFYGIERLDVVNTIIPYGLPSEIDALYSSLSAALSTMNDIEKLNVTDTTRFFYNYNEACERAKKIEGMENSVEVYLYDNLLMNTLMGINSNQQIFFSDLIEYARTAQCGYYDLSASLLGNADYLAFMAEYMTLVKNIIEIPDYESGEDYGVYVVSLFDRFVALEPTEQYALISSLNSLYSLGIPNLAFEDTQENIAAGRICLFALILNNYMRDKFTEEYTYVYDELILAIEVYANRFGYPEWEADFTARMEKIDAAMNTITGDDAANFEKYLSAAYKKYDGIRDSIGSSTELGTFAEKFDSLGEALVNLQTAHYYIESGEAANYNYFLASYERAAAISRDILTAEDKKIAYAYYHEPLFEAYSATDTEAATYWTYAYALTLYRNYYVDYLLFFGPESTNIYDTYTGTNLSAFHNVYYDTVSAFLTRGEGELLDSGKMISMLNEFKNLSSKKKSLFTVLEGDVDVYYSMLDAFINEEYSGSAAEAATKLFTLERYYYTYEISPSEVTLKSLEATLTAIKNLHEGFSESEAEDFFNLESVYTYYIALCEQLLGVK